MTILRGGMGGPTMATGLPQAPAAGDTTTVPGLGQAASALSVSSEQEAELVRKLSSMIDYHQGAFQPYADKAEEWQKMFQVIPKAKNKPWPGSSNFPVPFIAEKVMSIHARLVRAIFNVDPIFLVKPRLPLPPEVGQRVETFFDYLIDRGDYRLTMDLAVLYALIEGTAVIKVDYRRQTRNVQSSNPQASAMAGTANPGNPEQEVFTDFEGPKASFVPLRDFVVLPMEKYNLDDAQGCGHRFYLTGSQLSQREKDGIYTNAQALVDAKQTGEKPVVSATPILGELPEVPSDVVQQFELWELYFKYDSDGDGVEEPLLITFSKDSQKLLRVVPFPYDHGKAPYVPVRPMPQPNLFYGLSLSQFLEPIQKELTASYQRRADALARTAVPTILRMRGSTWNPMDDPLQPGGVITVSDPNEISALQLPEFTQNSVVHEQMLVGLGERITGISDYQVGRSAGQGRTLGEVQSVLAEGEVRIDVFLARIHESMKKLAELTFDITYQFMPYGGLMMVGQQAFRVTREMLRPPGIGFEAYEFMPNGSLSEASREQQLQRTMVMTQQMMQNPLLMDPAQNTQAPLVAAMLMKKVMVLAGWQDWEQYLPQIAQYQQAMSAGQPNPQEATNAAQAQAAQQAQELAMAEQQASIAQKGASAIATVAKVAQGGQSGG